MNLLRQRIEQEIRQHGPIPFSRYMELCLYDPELGYYSRSAEQFGKAGDFYTSSDIHAVFGRLLARQFNEMWQALDSPDRIEVVELGPGRGLFAQDALGWAENKFPDFFRALRYVLVETSQVLRARISETLKCHIASGKAELTNCYPREESARETPTIVFANEFFDALPVEILSAKGSVRIDACAGRFIETWVPSSLEELEFLDRHSIHPEPDERVEAPVAAQHFMDRIAASVQSGFLIAIDYGYTREEQLAGRHRGTLKTLRQHSISANPYEAPGEQDITADVNFTALAAAAEKHGMQTHKLVTQSQFLMGIGEANQFADAFEECRLPQERAKVALQLKHLVTPAGMGESFHALIASKGIAEETVSALSGLNFGRSRSGPHGERAASVGPERRLGSDPQSLE
ncbi:MAG TPA: SAM-dependent methyltransferase [Candidatus Polarisedimenticolia bacterium]|nr:SAM-dependent methyltransferase [Candidatus Polarisedimenticolia bacterium]